MRFKRDTFVGIALLLLFNFTFQFFSSYEFERFYEPIPNKIESGIPETPTPLNIEAKFMRLGIPTGTVDGIWDERTKQGLCIWRELTGLTPSRNLATTGEQAAIMKTDELKVAANFIVGMNINKTCQSGVWVRDAALKNFEIFIVSTGAEPGGTDIGTWSVTWQVNRWYESVQIPDGWMYKPIFFAYKGQALHGSEKDSFVHWYPASHGCVRMLHKDIEKLWAAGFGVGDKVRVYGKW